MFSGFVCVGMFTALGKSTFTVLLITGIVMRKMINSTNMTSTRGVVLMFAITPGSSLPDGGPTLIDIIVAPLTRPARRRHQKSPNPPPDSKLLADRGNRSSARTRTIHLVSSDADAGAAHEVGVQVAREIPQGGLQYLVAAQQPV